MANIQARRDKSGKLISYSIRVHRGRDADGRQLKPWTATFAVSPNWTEKSAKKRAEAFAQCHLVSGIECRATPEKNECIRQRMHFFWKKCMTRERIAKSAKKAIQNGRFMLLYK